MKNLIQITVFGWTLCLLPAVMMAAQVTKSVPASQLAVDVVSLKSGKTIRGAITSVNANGSLTMAVSREWLKQASPDLYQKSVAHEADLQKQVTEQLRDRLKKQLETPPNEQRLTFFLKQELERAEESLAGKRADASEFVWLELERDSIVKVSRAPADRQRVAMWAWSESLPHVESRDVQELERDLKQRKIDPTMTPPDLSNRLAPCLQDDREWAARMAIVEYTLAKSLDFQGTGDVLVRTDGERKGAADLAPVLSKVLQSQVDSFLKDLTGDGRPAKTTAQDRDWLKSASRQANDVPARGLRATRVDVKVDGNQANVQTSFAARMPDGTWEVVWSHLETQDATKARAETEAKIASDPQVKQVLETVKSFGLGADDQVRQAIRFGAATMAAQQAADARFFEFRDRYLKHLEGPPLTWSK